MKELYIYKYKAIFSFRQILLFLSLKDWGAGIFGRFDLQR